MSPQRPGRAAVALFGGGRGGAGIARELLRAPGIDLSVVINGYDNGLSTGALRRYLPGMLGPSDFRKNLLLHLDGADPRQAAMIAILEHRLPPGATRRDLSDLIDALAFPSEGGRQEFAACWPLTVHRRFAALPPRARAAIVRDLTVFRHRLDSRPDGLDLADCALGNLVFAGAYLRLGGDFNAAIRSCAETFESPARLVNVTGGENAFLVALRRDGRILADEADIVAPQDGAAIAGLFLMREPLSPRRRAELEAMPAERRRRALARGGAGVSLSLQARDAIGHADLVVYGPGTPHSSLLPSYLTPGIADAIAASRAGAKVFVVNLRDDHDVRGLNAADLVDLTLSYLGDPRNERRTVTHVLCHRPATPTAGTPQPPPEVASGGVRAGVRWVVADLEDPERPGAHCGRRTFTALAALAGVAGEATVLSAG
ncbi:2-phospho-L-lactate transferase CofD family protein [Planobispora takensis]|uniref:Gluconeogenesis factor n=1 Tax=Planobispora takensis TaxID=1367882 RepID=A0A8J3T7K9_9ACTN|nr:2-phospho-L-lactate transferase CofD family protein [Planobispora takensis]GII05583.1 hypothetical protein Pta02_75910 [Planobispora takensis]